MVRHPKLVGTVHFGHRNAADARTLVRLYRLARHPDLRLPLRRVVDGRTLAVIDDEAWTLMVEALKGDLAGLRGIFERQAVVVAPGLSGVRMAALLPALGPDDSFRLFTDARAAYVWADPEHGAAAALLVTSLCSEIDKGDVEPHVRAWIAGHLRHADLQRCAKSLGLSSRSLQRRLRDAGRPSARCSPTSARGLRARCCSPATRRSSRWRKPWAARPRPSSAFS